MWLILTMNGILWAYLRATAPSTPKVDGDGVAAALDRELDDVLRVEVLRVRGEAGAGRVLDALVDGQDRDVAGAGQPAGVEHQLEVPQHARAAVGLGDDPVDEIGAGQVQRLLGDRALWLSRLSASAPSSLATSISVPLRVAMHVMGMARPSGKSGPS